MSTSDLIGFVSPPPPKRVLEAQSAVAINRNKRDLKELASDLDFFAEIPVSEDVLFRGEGDAAEGFSSASRPNCRERVEIVVSC